MFQVIDRYAGAGAAAEHANSSPTAAAALVLLIRRTQSSFPGVWHLGRVRPRDSTILSIGKQPRRAAPRRRRTLPQPASAPLRRPTDSATPPGLSRWAPAVVAAPRQAG